MPDVLVLLDLAILVRLHHLGHAPESLTYRLRDGFIRHHARHLVVRDDSIDERPLFVDGCPRTGCIIIAACPCPGDRRAEHERQPQSLPLHDSHPGTP